MVFPAGGLRRIEPLAFLPVFLDVLTTAAAARAVRKAPLRATRVRPRPNPSRVLPRQDVLGVDARRLVAVHDDISTVAISASIVSIVVQLYARENEIYRTYIGVYNTCGRR